MITGEEHYDIGLYASNGVMTVGGWDHDTESMEVANLRLFEAHFGEDPAFPYSIDEPGIGGTADLLGMAPGESFSMNLIAGVRAWDGSGFSSSAESMGVSFGPASVDASWWLHCLHCNRRFRLAPRILHRQWCCCRLLSLEFTFSARVWPLQSPSSLCSTMAWTTRLFEENRRVGRSQHRACPRCMVALGWPRPPSSQPSRLIDFQLIPREWWR